MRTYFILSLIPYFIYIVCKSKKAMHMLQQNWYNDGNRYFKWILDNISKVFVTFDVLFVCYLIFDCKISTFSKIILVESLLRGTFPSVGKPPRWLLFPLQFS